MIDLMPTLLPISLFWILAAVYLGGWHISLRGGTGLREVLGLLISFLIWWVVWRLLHSAFGGLGPVLGGIVITTFAACLLLPAICWVGYKLVGVTIAKGEAGAH
ncbi:MAG: hypothetical protein HY560_06215 [Gemmatimonadetes bacterium]|nr:hypothetical protein [Gemmatimonadota bacterium]